MDMPDDATLGRPITSARELLQRFYYGHSDQVEKILTFARERKLDDDDLVFLLVSILKGNEELVRYILLAIDGAVRAIDDSHQAGKNLRALTQALIAQIEAAAARSAGELNIAADRFAKAAAHAEKLSNGMSTVAASLTRTEGVFERATEISNGKRALDRLTDLIRHQARADLRLYHAEVIEGLKHEIWRQVRVFHLYGLVGLIGCAGAFLSYRF